MAWEETLKTVTMLAPSTAYSGYQYRMIKASSSEGYFAAGSTKPTGEKISKGPFGVLQDAPTVTGEACQVATIGSITRLVRCSTDLLPGKHYIMGALGKAQSTDSAVAQDFILGPWLSAAASTDTVGTAMFNIVGIAT